MQNIISQDLDIKDKLMSLNTVPGTELSAFDNGSSSGRRDAYRNQIALPG